MDMRGFSPSVVKCAAMMLVLTLLAGCGSGKPSPPPATATTVAELTPEQIMAKASAQLAATQTIQFKLSVSGETFIDVNDQIQLLEASGQLVRPNAVETQFQVKLLGRATISMRLITIGEKHWSTDLITGKWGPAPEEFGYDPQILFNNQDGIGPVMNRVTDAQRLPNQTIQGQDCYHLTALVDQSIIGALTSESMKGNPITVDLWIETQHFNLLQAQLAEPKTVTGHVPATWVLSLTDQDKPITISPPNAPFSVSTPEASPVGSPAASPVASPNATPIATPGTAA